MRKKSLVLTAFAVLGLIAPVEGQKADWENPLVVERNKEAARTIFYSYDSPEKALAGNREQSFYINLDGQWRFNLALQPDARPKDFYRAD